MSENKDNVSPVTDSQETFYDKSQNINSSQMLDESQDFALIVGDDSDESVKHQTQAVPKFNDNESKENPVEKNVIEAEAEAGNEGSMTLGIEGETQHYSTQIDEIKKDELVQSLNMEDDVDDGISKEKRGSDEEEIIQGTPPEVSSPSRKLPSGKRKGDSIDEPAAKIQRTLPQRDALKLEREKACIDYKLILSHTPVEVKETQSDILCENTEIFDRNKEFDTCATQSDPQNIIITETQDSEDSEPILFDNTSDNENEGVKNKSQESRDENKTSMDQLSSQSDSADNKPKESETEVLQVSKEAVSTSENATEVATNGKPDENVAEDGKAGEAMDVAEAEKAEKKTCSESNEGPRPDKEFLNAILPPSDSASNSDSNCEAESNSSNKSRKSIEVIYDRNSTSQEKKRPDLVKIDEEGEEIVLDSSNEGGEKIVLDSSNDDIQLRFSTGSTNNSPQNTTVYKSCTDTKSNSESSYKSAGWSSDQNKRKDAVETSDYQLTNGDEERTTSGSTKTISSGSDQLVDDLMPDTMKAGHSKSAENHSNVEERFNFSDTMDLANLVSDSDGDSILANENIQNKTGDKANISSNISTDAKVTVHEKKFLFHGELKYLLHVDDNTKEVVYKEVMDMKCEPVNEPSRPRRNSDNSGCVADISGNANQDTSPGSVISTAPFQPPPSRFSIASTMSSSSSASSAASLALKLHMKDAHFSLPKGRAKHARRSVIGTVFEEKLNVSDNFEKLTQGWKNAHLITDSVLQSANMVINSPEVFQHDTESGKTEENILSSTPEPESTEDKVLSSTPVQDERVTSQLATPKSTKTKKPLKRTRTKSNSTTRSNGIRKASPEVITTSQEDRVQIAKKKRDNIDTGPSDKSSKMPSFSTPSRLRPETPRLEALRSLTPQNLPNDELVGKTVFARWSDKNYYPGEVTEKVKEKFKVQFYDGKSKLLIEEFVIPIPELLRKGLSVYATTNEGDYASMGIIEQSENVDDVIYYTVEMDNGKRVTVQTKDIFLMPGQAAILKEEVDLESKSLPRTPQHLGKVSLDNLVDGKRRQPATPTFSTPKSRKGVSPRASKVTDSVPASGSGIPKMKRKPQEISSSESDTKTSDSNVSSIEDVDGVQPELATIPAAEISKGPPSRMKGRGRSKSKQTPEDIELGPIPPASSKIFQNMSFILTSTSSDIISHHKTDDSCSEAGTENEEQWLRIPFIKERIKAQLINGGGTVYDSFKLLPKNEYKNTKLITNAPNLTAKSIQCLSVGIPVYNHEWVIQSCRENKALSPSKYELPAGWSLEKKDYIESYDRINNQPFNGMIIGMPMVDDRNAANRSIHFWRRICENAGAGVQIIDGPETDFSQATVILTDNRCPSWLVEKADNSQIHLVSTVWIVQCIIAGRSLGPEAHPQYKHTFIQS